MKTEKSIVAFIDILGAKKLIENDADNSLIIIHDCFSCVKNEMKKMFPENVNVPKVNIFSDNIVISLPVMKTDSSASDKDMWNFISVIAYVALIQYYFWKNNLLVRGAVSFGSFYSDDLMVWGTGLTNSYLLESGLAIYPRIVIDPKYARMFIDLCKILKYEMFTEDFDGVWFVDPFRSRVFNYREDVIGFLEDNRARIKEATEKNDSKLYQKFVWLQKYFEENLARMEEKHERMESKKS